MGRKEATLHLCSEADGRFTLREFHRGTYDIVENKGLSARAVADVLADGPAWGEILCFGPDGYPSSPPQAVHDALWQKGKRGFVPARPCPTCGSTGKVAGQACPDCARTWNFKTSEV